MNNKKNIGKKKKISNGGYTLVELLAMVSLLSIISVIVIYTSMNIVDSANNKSYKVTINEIEKIAGTYAIENSSDILWLDDDYNIIYQYQCITVQNLIDKGYFDNNILNSKIDKNRNISSIDYVYVEKDRNTKTITRSVLLYNNPQLNGLCDVDTIADGIIEFNIPSGFAKSKEITITYTLKSSIGNASNYKYSYGFDADNSSDKDIGEQSLNFNTKNKIVKKIIVDDNGWVFAKIDKTDNTNINNSSIYVNGVDTNGPVIASNATSTTVRGSVVIPVIINDIGSGIKGDSINLSDFKVSIGNKILTENFSFEKVSSNLNTYNYNLKIENYNYEGEVKIVIDKDRILDNLGNGNVDTVISTGVIFSNKYTISYNSTGGTGTMNSTICTYGNICTLSTNIFTKTGYTFLGWSTSSNTNTVVYNDKYVFNVFDNKYDIDLYAVWKANTYAIIYNANGGSGTMSDTNCTYDSNCTLRANSFTRTGYTFAGWNLKKDGTGSSYADQESVKNLTGVDGKTITLYAQWNANTYTIKYDANGGSGTMSNSTHTFGVPKNLNANKFTRTGYTFAGWNLKKDGTGGSYADQESVKNLTGVDGKTITLYAQWKASVITITFDANGGIMDGEGTLITTVGQTQYVVPKSGEYKLEVWGAQGATYEARGGYGGYSVGTVNLEAGTILYANVGGKGSGGNEYEAKFYSGGYNGGGTGIGSGGGATHIATASGELKNLSSNKNAVLIVAGGGGGAYYGGPNTTGQGGDGGGYQGVAGDIWVYGSCAGSGGSQTAGGSGCGYGVGSFGKGGSSSDRWGSAGGGGWYGGGASPGLNDLDEGYSPGGGGSGYIGNSLLTDKAMYCYGCSTSTDTSTLTYLASGASADPIAKYAKEGNGAIKISSYSAVVKNYPVGSTYGTLPTPTRTDYIFKGWNTKADGTGTYVTSNSIVNLDSSQRLYAIWESTILYLYNNGTWNTSVTGNLTAAGRMIDDYGSGSWEVPTISKGTSSVTVKQKADSSGYTANGGWAYFATTIDLTGYKTLRFNGSFSGGGHNGVGVWSSTSGSIFGSSMKASIRSLSGGVGTVDVSSLNGKYYIGFYVYNAGVYVTCKSLSLEK